MGKRLRSSCGNPRVTTQKSRVCTPNILARWPADHIPEYVKKYASQDAADQDSADDDAGDDMSSVGSYDSDDEEGEPAGNMDDI